jgi:hypothetical protein
MSTSGLRPSSNLTCSQPFFFKVVSVKVDHYPHPTVIMYCPYLMVLIYVLPYPSTQLDPTVEKSLEEDQRSRMIVGSSTSMTFKIIVEFCNGNFSLVVELIPTIYLLTGDHRRSMWILEQLACSLSHRPNSAIEVV